MCLRLEGGGAMESSLSDGADAGAGATTVLSAAPSSAAALVATTALLFPRLPGARCISCSCRRRTDSRRFATCSSLLSSTDDLVECSLDMAGDRAALLLWLLPTRICCCICSLNSDSASAWAESSAISALISWSCCWLRRGRKSGVLACSCTCWARTAASSEDTVSVLGESGIEAPRPAVPY